MREFALRVMTAKIGETHLFSVGQAGYIIKSRSGQLLAHDLYLSECVERVEGNVGFKRLLPKILGAFELEFDCIITSHPHLDHFDMDAVPQMMSNSKTRLFASLECKREVNKLNMLEDNVVYVKPNDTYEIGDFKLDFVNCDHGTGAPDAVGVIVTVDDKKIYFAGDTCLRLDRVEEYCEKVPFDVMIAPINGAFGNLNEMECAMLCEAIQPKLVIPSHYGMFASHGGNPGMFYQIMTEKYPQQRFLLMQQGEKLTL